nr:RNA-dependent RNA polymerase [Barnaviridae sp.]
MVIRSAFHKVEDMLREGVEKVTGLSSQELIASGLTSPIRVFVKQEPHKQAKLELGRYRLISGLALDDQILDRALFGVQNQEEILRWDECPSKPGIGLHDDGLRLMASTFREMLSRGNLVSTDVSGWDWSVQEWELLADLEARRRLNGTAVESAWYTLARVRFHCVANKAYVLPDGATYSQSHPGIMASGWYNTSSTNSRMRIIARATAHAIHCERTGKYYDPDLMSQVVAMGDDAVEVQLDEDSRACLEELGHVIKDVAVFDRLQGIEFCSHRWHDDGLAAPVNLVKTLFKFFNHPASSPQLADWGSQLLYECRNARSEIEQDALRLAMAFVEEAKLHGAQQEQS